MSPNFEYIAVVLDDYCDMQTSGFIPTANRYPVADVQEQVALLGQLEPAGNAVLANRIAELEREVSMHRNAEITWEKTMMQAVGEDGPKSVVEAIDKIKAERDAAMAQASNVLSAAQQLSFEIACDPSEPQFKSFARLQDVLDKAPQQHLAERDAQAVEGAIKFCNHHMAFPVNHGKIADKVIAVDELIMYAENIRQEKK